MSVTLTTGDFALLIAASALALLAEAAVLSWLVAALTRGIDAAFDALAAFVRSHDDNVFTRAGFLVSPQLGLAFVPAEPDWVTALAPHCIASWRGMDAGSTA